MSDYKSLFWREIKKLKKKENYTTINGTDNNSNIVQLSKDKFQTAERVIEIDIDDESRSRICRRDNFFCRRDKIC